MQYKIIFMNRNIMFLLCLVAVTVNGQRFNGGMVAGLSTAQVDGDSYAGYDKLGLQGGVFVNTMFSSNIGVQLEIKYTGKGARKKTSVTDPEVYKLTLHYIDMPIMLQLVAKEKFITEAGLVPGYLFQAAGEDDGGKLPNEYLVKFNKFDVAMMLGFRYKINGHFSAGIRYAYSLISVNDQRDSFARYSSIGNLFGYTTGDYNNYLTFGVYYQFY